MSRLKTVLSERLIGRSNLFDPIFYCARYPDVLQTSADPLRHYVCHGAQEGRDPSAAFDTAYYLSQYPDLNPEEINPLCHYILVGERDGAWPNRYFDPLEAGAHLRQMPAREENFLSAYLALGPTHISPSSRLIAGPYLNAHPLAAAAGVSPLSHRLSVPASLDMNCLFSGRRNQAKFGGSSGLDAVAIEGGYIFLHVADNDPYIVLDPRETDAFEAGHYRLTAGLRGTAEDLLLAKLYLDHGAGFNERDIIRPHFVMDERGVASALIALDAGVQRIRLDPVDNQQEGLTCYALRQLGLEKISTLNFYSSVIDEISTSPLHTGKLMARTLLNAARQGPSAAAKALCDERAQRQKDVEGSKARNVLYRDWIARFDTISADDRTAMRQAAGAMPEKPLISIIMPVYNTPENLLRECIDSVIDQTYLHWELCIADDKSPAPHIRKILEEYEQRDSRVRCVFRSENGHISAASNSAIEIARGAWMALLDHDDLLPPHALFCVADAINKNPDARLFYSDEDKIDLDGERSDPHFKTDWNERLFFEQNMVSHLGVYDIELIREIGGFRKGYEGSQDHDLVLRAVEKISPEQIVHIPHILYHWRIVPGSTAMGAGEKSYALEAGVKALRETIDRRGLHGKVEVLQELGYYRLKLDPPAELPLVSIVIPTRDGLDVLEPCIRSVLETTTYPNFEIIIVDNQSEKEETLAYFRQLEETPNVRVLPYDDVFNYSAINNYAVGKAEGSLICLLNNDTEVLSPDWLSEMVAELSRQGVGAVGAKLVYTDGTVQHAGVILGVGGEKGVAGHGLLSLSGEAGGYFSYAKLAREVSAVTAACLLTTRDIFDEVGGLNEGALRVAFNDVDLCLKIREAGYKIIWTPHALLHHHESKSRGLEDTPEKQQRFTGEVGYMLERWGELLQNDPYYNPNLSLNAETYSLAGKPRVTKPWNRAV